MNPGIPLKETTSKGWFNFGSFNSFPSHLQVVESPGFSEESPVCKKEYHGVNVSFGVTLHSGHGSSEGPFGRLLGCSPSEGLSSVHFLTHTPIAAGFSPRVPSQPQATPPEI